MSHPVQFVVGPDGQPQYAVLPYALYQTISSSLPDVDFARHSTSLLSADKTRIVLPNGGPNAHLDLVQLAHYVADHGVTDMAINQRAQSLDKFPLNQRNSLDPLIRIRFLPKDSPYMNTMQATTAVVDALVESGLFTRTKISYPGLFFRPVNAIASCQEAIAQFCSEHPEPATRITMPAP